MTEQQRLLLIHKKSAAGQSEDLQALAKLMNNEPVSLNKHFDMHRKELKKSMKIQKRGKKICFTKQEC